MKIDQLLDQARMLKASVDRETALLDKAEEFLKKQIEERAELEEYSESLERAPFSKVRKSELRLKNAHLCFDEWQARHKLNFQCYAQMCGFRIIDRDHSQVKGRVEIEDRFFEFIIWLPYPMHDSDKDHLHIGFTEVSIYQGDKNEKVPKLLLMSEEQCLSKRSFDYLKSLGIRKHFNSQLIEKDHSSEIVFFELPFSCFYDFIQGLKADF